MPTLPSLLLRADAGPGIGSGHLGRCLALAQAWQDLHGEAALATLRLPEHWRRRFETEGVTVHDRSRSATPRGADWCVVDTYRHETEELAWAREHAARVLHIDDHAIDDHAIDDHAIDDHAIDDHAIDDHAIDDHARSSLSDLTLNQNFIASGGSQPPTDKILAGPRYSLIRRELRVRIEKRSRETSVDGQRPADHDVLKLLVSLGGEPDAAVRRFCDSVLSDELLSELDHRRLDGFADVGTEMADADLAFSAAGSTAWELCAFGVPMVIFAAADNQISVAEPLSRSGAAIYVGPLEGDPVDSAVSALHSLAMSPSRRVELGSKASSLVDGTGALRVAARLRAAMVRTRAAAAADADLLWDWANDRVTRESSFSPGLIEWDEHVAWLNAVLTDPRRRLYLMEDHEGAPIGQVRFDAPEVSTESGHSSSEISFSVAADNRGSGWGGAIIDSAVRHYFADSGSDIVVARTLHTNFASQRALLYADFDEVRQGDGSRGWREFHRHRITSYA